MDIDKLDLVFSDVLTEIVSIVSGFSLEVLSQEEENNFEDMTGVMCLNGKKCGILFISANEDIMRILCSYMTAIPQPEIKKEDMEDALCELVNMTAGSAKLRLSASDYAFNLSSPYVIKGQNMLIVPKNKTHVISKVLGNEEITIKLKVVY